ncbi:MAG: PqqD family protein [Pseudomonadota bacterium]
MNPEKKPNLEIEVVDDEMIVLDADNQKVHKLNGTAAAVLESCDGSNSVDDIVTWLAGEFGVPTERVDADVRQILEVFSDSGLLKSVEDRIE